MLYHVMASNQTGVMNLKRDSIDGALKKARELRAEGLFNEVRIVEHDSGTVVDEAAYERSGRA